MRRLFQVVHHRSLTASIVTLFVGFLAFGFVLEYGFQLQQGGSHFHLQASVMAVVSVIFCAGTLGIFLHDDRAGYPSFRLSLATFLWALACFPVVLLVLDVI